MSGKSLGDKFKDAGNSFLFNMALEYARPSLVDKLRDEILVTWTPEMIMQMIKENRMPDLPPKAIKGLAGLSDKYQYIKAITERDLFEAVKDARPDISQAILDCRVEGIKYMCSLREYFLAIIAVGKNGLSPEPGAEQPAAGEKKGLVNVQCDTCKRSVTLPREDALKLKECPLCHAPA